MSGGYFERRDYNITMVADDIQNIIDNNDQPDRREWDCAGGHNYPSAVIKELKSAVKALRIAAIYAHRVDYLLSSDDGESSFLNRLKEELKEANK